MRLFVAADIPDDVRESIERDTVEPVRERVPGARWTRPDGRHLTLKFLGDVADEQLGEITSAASSAVASHEPFEAAFAEAGGFPNLHRPRVLWIGIGEGAERFAALARDLDEALEPLGFAPEKRSFTCHVTLARFKEPRSIEAPDLDVRPIRFGVREVVLFRSHLHPKGARYEALERFALNG